MGKADHTPVSWITLKPPFKRQNKATRAFLSHARRLSRLAMETERSSDSSFESVMQVRDSFEKSVGNVDDKYRATLWAAGLVLIDLVAQGWPLRVKKNIVQVTPPTIVVGDRAAEKNRVRKQELVKRDAQLQEPATLEFIADLERARLFGDEFVSVFNLMRDGRELAGALLRARQHNNNGWADALKGATDPYLQFVSPEVRCKFTGLRLIDVWRYFRHTWTNQYATVPGRSMLFLVRDRAAPYHPVVGIGALSSPIMQIRERDRWVGWNPDVFLEAVRQKPTERTAKWLLRQVASAINEIYIDDFIEDGILMARSLREPKDAQIAALISDGIRQRKRHHRYARSREYKDRRPQDGHWLHKARGHLFRSKRALALAELLRVRSILTAAFGRRPTAQKLAQLLDTGIGRKAVSKIIRKVKATRIGIAVADISVCGAVQPYNAILGGKLVSMLAASTDTVIEYRRRYGRAESEIASSMAGRAIVRPANLVLLGTTSLYGVGSSQYNRIKIPCGPLGGRADECIEFEELGRSQSFGTSQYSEKTVDALVTLVQQTKEGQRVNSIFGEGISPKLRKVRHGLDLLGFPSNLLLRHYRQRVVYGVSLVRNLRIYLTGLSSRPDYLIPKQPDGKVTASIAAWWRERWLRGRIQNDAVLEEVAKHTHVRPISHGARVPAPDHSLVRSFHLESISTITETLERPECGAVPARDK